MTFARIFGWEWTAWNLRSPFYPLVFIFPVQLLLHRLGHDDPATLVAAGRFVVTLFSLANLWLTFVVARKLFNSIPVGLLSALLLATNRLHVIAGSTELPRTVSSFFVLASFFWLIDSRQLRAGLAGASMGLGAVLRFSEVIFVVPALLQLAATRRWRDLGLFTAGLGLTTLFVLGPIDQLYWGTPFFSLMHVADFTLVQGLSTRGYQPFGEYARILLAWTDPLIAVAAAAAVRLRVWRLMGWTGLPVFLLSLLPHKEVQYLIPVLPFFSMLAAASLWRLLTWLATDPSSSAHNVERRPRMAALLLAAAVSGLLWEARGYPLRRSDDAVRIARHIAADAGPEKGFVSMQDWPFGGRLYLGATRRIVNLDPALMGDRDFLRRTLEPVDLGWVVLPAGDIRRFDAETLLKVAGFEEVSAAGTLPEPEYRLFRRLPNR